MFGLNINRDAAVPITSQLISQMREAILYGRIDANSKMPPTRTLADELNVSRNTVIQVYEQLIAEGYLTSVMGSGTFVTDLGEVPKIKRKTIIPREHEQHEHDDNTIAFYAGNPDVSVFPRAMWARALKEACLDADEDAFGYGDPQGAIALRRALTDYLYRAKGIYCGSERIFIVPGTSAGIEIISSLLYTEGGCAAIEDPCLTFARRAAAKSGLKIIPVESDTQGIRTELLPDDQDVKLIYTAPSHQYPLGGVLPITRRLGLLDYAQRHGAYIIEDDYDSEFRYHGEPIQSLWNLNDERVIYLGSFSNVFAPSLRMAYFILPQDLLKNIHAFLSELNIWAGTLEQIALAHIIESKQFDRHIYRMKRLYDSKRKFLIRCLEETFGSEIKISGEFAGLHLMLTLNKDITSEDRKFFAENGVEVDYAEDYAVIKGRHKNKIVLGYGNLSESEIEEGVRRLRLSLK